MKVWHDLHDIKIVCSSVEQCCPYYFSYALGGSYVGIKEIHGQSTSLACIEVGMHACKKCAYTNRIIACVYVWNESGPSKP